MKIRWEKRRAAQAPAAVSEETADEQRQLLEDIRKAHLEWTMAQWRFHEALGYDQVDYAIYSLEAAEKKYIMLLRKAKRLWKPDSSPVDGSAAGKGGGRS